MYESYDVPGKHMKQPIESNGDTVIDDSNALKEAKILSLDAAELQAWQMQSVGEGTQSAVELLESLKNQVLVLEEVWSQARNLAVDLEFKLEGMMNETGMVEEIKVAQDELRRAQEYVEEYQNEVSSLVTAAENQEELDQAEERLGLYSGLVSIIEAELKGLIGEDALEELLVKQEELRSAKEREALLRAKLIKAKVDLAEIETKKLIFPDAENTTAKPVMPPIPPETIIKLSAIEKVKESPLLQRLLQLEVDIENQKAFKEALKDQEGKAKAGQELNEFISERSKLIQEMEPAELEVISDALRVDIIPVSQETERTITEGLLGRIYVRLRALRDEKDKRDAFQRQVQEIAERKAKYGVPDSQNNRNNSFGNSNGAISKNDLWAVNPDAEKRRGRG